MYKRQDNELAFLSGATSNIQDQIDAIITGDLNLTPNRATETDANGDLIASAVTNTELSYPDGVTSSIQAQLNGKEPSVALPVNKALITDGSGGLLTSSTTDTEISFVSGVTSSIQTQLDGKEPTITSPTDLSIKGLTITCLLYTSPSPRD